MLQWLKKTFRKAADTGVHPDPDSGGALRNEDRLNQLEEILGFSVTNPVQYERALRHRSIIDEDLYEQHETYERLEFLGDAVLDLIVTEILFEHFPKQDEGFMTKLRARIVKGETLANLAKEMGLNQVLEVGERAGGQGIEMSKSVLSDIFESLVAAIYIVEGYPKAFHFIERVLQEHLDLEEVSVTVDNFKSVLLEYTQANRLPLPRYRVVAETGPGHDKTFEVAVSIDGRDYGIGTGKSKKEAEQLSAKQAIAHLQTQTGETTGSENEGR